MQRDKMPGEVRATISDVMYKSISALRFCVTFGAFCQIRA